MSSRARGGPKALTGGVWRTWEEGEDFGPVLVEMSAEDVERREGEKEREGRRMRRETHKFGASKKRFRN
jgi:hypothetical protein